MPLRMQRDSGRASSPVRVASFGFVFAAAVFFVAQPVRAQAPAPAVERGFVNNGWSFGVNGEYSDNAMRTLDDGEEETSVAAFTSLDIGYISPRWRLDVIGDLEYRHYVDSLEDDQLLGGGTGRIEFSILEEYLSVFGEDVYGQTQIDADVPDSPSNRGYINSLTYGANGRVPLGSRLSIVGMGAQSRITYDDSDLNYDRTDYSAGLEQRLSEQTRLTLSAMRMRNKFDIDPNLRNYDLEEAWLGLIGEYPRTSIDLSVGQTRI
jgi:hypothetical protein